MSHRDEETADVEPSPLARRAHRGGRVCPVQRRVSGSIVVVARIVDGRHRRANGEFQADDAMTYVYFGNGCFWGRQHEFVALEKDVLHRSDVEVKSLAGYAGGKRGGGAKTETPLLLRQFDTVARTVRPRKW